jgi:hypothetical protein
MSDIIIVAVISFAGTLLGAYFSNQKTVAVQQEQIKSLREDIVQLSDRVDRHNNFDSRLAAVEAIIERLEAKL